MRQHHDPDPYEEDEENLEGLGTPVYQGTGLSVRALTAEELQRFLEAHHAQPARLLGSGWTALDPPEHPLGGPRTHRPPRCRRCPPRSRAAWAAPAARPWPPTGAAAPRSWPPGPAAWPGGRRWSLPPASPPRSSPPRPACPTAGW
jgi:hypothetical protein